MNLLSIDPGITGGVAVIIDGVPEKLYSTETMKMGSKKMVDPDWLRSLMIEHDIDFVVIEQVGASPQMGVSSAFNFGFSFGAAIGSAAGAEVHWGTITPVYWKTSFGLLKKGKDAARQKALELFPDLHSQLKLKKDVDKADALLIGMAWLRKGERRSKL